MNDTICGKRNLAAGFLFLAAFMLYGFALIYLRDFAPGKAEWIASYTVGKHFESRLAHAHGNLFAFLNMVLAAAWMGLAALKLNFNAPSQA